MVTAAHAVCEPLTQPLASVSDPAIYERYTWQPLFARLRREASFHYCTESRYGPHWAVTRYHDIMALVVGHASYSSQLGGIPSRGGRLPSAAASSVPSAC